MAGGYYSVSITTSGADEDLFDTIKTTLGGNVVATSVDIISADNVGICVNNLKDSGGDYIYSYLYLENSLYKASIRGVQVSSLVVETSGHDVWISIIYSSY